MPNTETIPTEVIEAMAQAAEIYGNANIREALKAAEAANYVLVPIEATKAMINGGLNSSRDADQDLYRAMIAARPKVPHAQD